MGTGLHPHGLREHDLRRHPMWNALVAIALLAALWALGILIYSVLLPLTG